MIVVKRSSETASSKSLSSSRSRKTSKINTSGSISELVALLSLNAAKVFAYAGEKSSNTCFSEQAMPVYHHLVGHFFIRVLSSGIGCGQS